MIEKKIPGVSGMVISIQVEIVDVTKLDCLIKTIKIFHGMKIY